MKFNGTLTLSLAIIAAFTLAADEHEHDHAHHDAENAVHAQSVSVPLSVQKVMGLKTVKCEKRSVASTFSFPGRYELRPEAMKSVSTPVKGRVTFFTRELDNVRKGDILFTITSPDLVARSHEISALEKRLKVYQEINSPNAALKNEIDVKKSERKALLDGAEEKDGVVTIRSSSDATVRRVLARDGDYLDLGAPAVETVNPKLLHFKALVPASEALQLKNVKSAKVDGIRGDLRIGIGDESGLVPAYVVFPGEIDAIAAQGAIAECALDNGLSEVIAVPSKCIVSIGLKPTLFVRDAADPERFTAVHITPGTTRNGWTGVEGLSCCDAEIVSDGVYELKLSLSENGKRGGAGHFHADGTFHQGEH